MAIHEVTPSHLVHLRAEDLEFGRQQVDQMMSDREEMRTYVEKNDVIYNWAVRQFAGEAAGQRIYWRAGSFIGYPAECLSYIHTPTSTSQGYVSIRDQYSVLQVALHSVDGLQAMEVNGRAA